ncbi:DM13 domain-containing protein [Streptomyces sp. CHD11]|uniref:DM13 domain-containing protein n=1 Tax=Streptomyces sp. CHD11 TaxID=2741325 RepID=UPI001BFCCD3E|nr:DM13 domain-containing protein [Streptomyces sp. CHD11]MBT3155269.1 DM13 domain-containing protein [Streptomyces sp. CHD11]
MGRVRSALFRPWTAGVLMAAVVAGAFGLYWFQPWKLWQDETVQEALPEVTAVASTPPAGSPSGTAATPPPAGPVTLASGEMISHEHATSGTVRFVRLADGSHVVRLEGLDTSNGPDLHVWLTDAPVKEGRAGWHVFDDGRYVTLGKLKGNKGSQNYTVPEDVDPSLYTSVTIWCDRFDVSFGAAELARA